MIENKKARLILEDNCEFEGISFFIFWVATMGDKAKEKGGHEEPKGKMVPGAIPAMAGGSPALDSMSASPREK